MISWLSMKRRSINPTLGAWGPTNIPRMIKKGIIENLNLFASNAFEDAEARQIAGILGGMVYKPKALESIEIALDDLVIEWFKVREHAELAGKTLGDIDLRKDYGVNIIAVMNKNKKKELNPGPRTTIDSGDTIVISGQRNGVKRFSHHHG